MDLSYIDEISKTKAVERKALVRWLSTQGDEIMTEAIRMQGEMASRNRASYNKNLRAEFYYALFIRAAAKLKWMNISQTQKAALSVKETSQLSQKRISSIKASRRYKPSPKKEIIRVRFFHEIEQLREQGLSWRQISVYLKTYHKVSIGFTYLKSAFEALQKEKMEVDG